MFFAQLILATVLMSATTPQVIEQRAEPIMTELSPQREVWVKDLEQCESGSQDVINKMDTDGTPSYYWFQFKPSTFESFAIKYKLLPNEETEDYYFEKMHNRDLQLEIVKLMVLDESVNLRKQFPGCTTKLGLPPK